MIQTGTVGVAGTTGALVYNSRFGIRALMDRSLTERSVTRNLDQQVFGAGSDTGHTFEALTRVPSDVYASKSCTCTTAN